MRGAVFLAFALGASCAWAEEIEIFVDKSRSVGTLSRVIEPEYPKALLAAGKGGHVDIKGSVTPLGELENVRYVPDSASSEAFVAPLREVIPYWKFSTETDNECRPVATEITTRMFFEVVDGKPKVSVSHSAWPKPKPELRSIKHVQPEYPKRALARQHESTVYAGVDITPEGNVASTQLWAYPEYNSGNLFKDAARTAILQWQYPPASPGRTRRICYEFPFKLVN